MLHVACVRHGEAFGVEYVERLFDMVRRNLPDGFAGRFVCFTDRPDDLVDLKGIDVIELSGQHSGWWAKLELFTAGPSDGIHKGDRVWYFDLDTCIVGPLDGLFEYEGGFAILEDVYRPRGFQSSVMSFIAGTPLTESIYQEWAWHNYPEPAGGDQAVLEEFWRIWLPKRIGGDPFPPEFLQSLYPGRFRSYKRECTRDIPKGTSVVFFHGIPRPHQVLTGWVPDIWRLGGGGAVEFVSVGTVPQEKVLENVREAIARGYSLIEELPPNDRLAVICAGGPSLHDHRILIASLAHAGASVFAVNQVDHYLRTIGIVPNFHVMVDARPELTAWVNDGGIKLYASMCDPAVLEKADKVGDLSIWHPVTQGIEDLLGKSFLIGGGCTVGTRAIALAYVLGFRQVACIGFDSCLREGEHHAYSQKLNDKDPILDVAAAGRTFKAAPWMVEQAQQFVELSSQLNAMGCAITVFGEGLLPTLFAASSGQPNHADLRCRQILEWIENTVAPHGVEVGVFAGDLSRRLLAKRQDLHLYMVDSWTTATPGTPYAETGSGDFHGQLTQDQQDSYLERTRNVVHFAGPRAHIVRADSLAAAETFADASLDFVFIDADHSYEGCAADIRAWLPKVKPGGWIGGHDYENTDYPEFGVKRAVDEMFCGTEHCGAPIELGKNFT